MVIGEGMNSSANHLLDPKCPSGMALLGALKVCLLGTTYAIEDVLVSECAHGVVDRGPDSQTGKHVIW
jgi:hypothetical protein